MSWWKKKLLKNKSQRKTHSCPREYQVPTKPPKKLEYWVWKPKVILQVQERVFIGAEITKEQIVRKYTIDGKKVKDGNTMNDTKFELYFTWFPKWNYTFAIPGQSAGPTTIWSQSIAGCFIIFCFHHLSFLAFMSISSIL